jgi:hypothetical protein
MVDSVCSNTSVMASVSASTSRQRLLAVLALSGPGLPVDHGRLSQSLSSVCREPERLAVDRDRELDGPAMSDTAHLRRLLRFTRHWTMRAGVGRVGSEVLIGRWQRG